MPSSLISPMAFLLLVLAITVSAGAVAAIVRRRRQRLLLGLARQHRMQYSPRDVFMLAPRIAAHLPVPGAADVRVRDVIYGSDEQWHRCIFCAEMTVGVIQSKSRQWCVASLLEPRGCGGQATRITLQVAPQDRPLLEQYRALLIEAAPAPHMSGDGTVTSDSS